MAVTSAQATIAARIERIPLFSLHRKFVFVLGIGTFFDLFDVALGGLLAAILANLYHLNTFQTAAVIASGFFGMFVGAIALGYPLGSLLSVPLVERVERKWLIIGSALLMALFGLIFGFATSVPIIIASGFLLTVASQFFSNGYHIYQAEIFPTRMRGTAVGVAYSLSRLSSAILPFVALPFHTLLDDSPSLFLPMGQSRLVSVSRSISSSCSRASRATGGGSRRHLGPSYLTPVP